MLFKCDDFVLVVVFMCKTVKSLVHSNYLYELAICKVLTDFNLNSMLWIAKLKPENIVVTLSHSFLRLYNRFPAMIL